MTTADDIHHPDELEVVAVVLPTEVDDPTPAGDVTGKVEAGDKELLVHHDVPLEELVEPDVLVLDETVAGLETVELTEEVPAGELHQPVEVLVVAGVDAVVIAELTVDVLGKLLVIQNDVLVDVDAVFCEFQTLGLDVLAPKSDKLPASSNPIVNFRIRPPKSYRAQPQRDSSDFCLIPLRYMPFPRETNHVRANRLRP